MALPAEYADAATFCMGDSEELSDWLLSLVLAGRKTATCGPVRDFTAHEPIPVPGRRDVILDWRGAPACAIETLSTRRGPISSVTWEFVQAEGEGDESIAAWLKSHGDYYARNGGFSLDLDVIFEYFRVVDVFPRPGRDAVSQ